MARAKVRTQTSPTMRGTAATWEGRFEHKARYFLPSRPRVGLSWWGVAALCVWTSRRLGRWWWRHRDHTVPLTIGATLDLFFMPTVVSAGLTLAVAWVSRRALASARSARRLARIGRQWHRICKACGIVPTPDIERSREDDTGLELIVRLPEETKPEKFVTARRSIGTAARATCQLSDLGHGRWQVTLRTVDVLAREPEFEPLEVVNPTAVPLGIDASGREVSLPIFEAHWLIGGASGAGKSTTLNALIAHLAAIPGVVLWGVDAQHGVTFAPWRHLFARFATTPETAVGLVHDWYTAMDLRAQHMAKVGVSLATPGRWPLHVLLIDELAQVIRQPDKDAGKAAQADLWRSLSLGRKCGFAVVAATQDPRADIIGSDLRALFTHTLALRCRTSTESQVMLGPGTVTPGWNAAEVPAGQPGRGILAAGPSFMAVRCYRLVPPFDLPQLSSKCPQSVPGDTSSPGITPSDLPLSISSASRVLPDTRPLGLPSDEAEGEDGGDLRMRLAAVLLDAGDVGARSADVAARLGVHERRVRRHFDALGARAHKQRWFHPDHDPHRRAS